MKLMLIGAGLLIAAAALFVPIRAATAPAKSLRAEGADLSSFSAEKPAKPIRLLYIHHSVGGALMADEGPAEELANCILKTHPEGGGLRARLHGQGYEVHEASYGSKVGDKTDLFDWLPKFRGQMDEIRTCDFNDKFYTDDRTNKVVVFKSCYPNSRFVGEGDAPGNPAGPDLTLWNAKATLNAVREEFARNPDVLFVYMTAPPMASKAGAASPAWKVLARRALGKPDLRARELEQSGLAREFNNWVKSPEGWLKDYPLKNVAVFDLYDVLTNEGETNLLSYPSGDGANSHPAKAGNTKAAAEFVPFLNRVVRRAGLTD